MQQVYFVTAGVPISNGPGFLTPLFATERSNSLFYQDIHNAAEVVGFCRAPERAADRAIGINSTLQRRVGDPPYYAFRDLSGNISVETIDRLSPILREEFKELHAHPHLQKSIATALKDTRLMGIVIEALRRQSGVPSQGRSFGWHARSEALVRGGHVAPVLFPGSARVLDELSNRRANTLLVGARGTGKTLILKLLQRRLEAAGRQTLWVDARASHVPLAVSLALSQARENGDYFTLSAKALVHSRAERKFHDDDMKQLRQSLEKVVEQIRAGEVAVLIDDAHLFDNVPDWPREFQNAVLLTKLFRTCPSNIFATTAHALGSANLFGRMSVLSPSYGIDYRVAKLAEARHRDDIVAKDLIGNIIASRAPQIKEFKPDIDALAEYASAENPRRVLTFLDMLEKSGEFAASAVKVVHSNYMKELFAFLETHNQNIGSHEYARQIRTIVEAVKKAAEQLDRRRKQFGRSPPAKKKSVFFRISLADDIAVLSQAIDNGLLLLRHDHEIKSDVILRFPTYHDEQFFIEHYDNDVLP